MRCFTESACAVGNQQRANVSPSTHTTVNTKSNSRQLIYGETTFICPSHWLAEAFSGSGHTGYKYQYSVPAAIHAADLGAYFGAGNSNFGPDFIKAFESTFSDLYQLRVPQLTEKQKPSSETS
jgi:carboxylesterase type B